MSASHILLQVLEQFQQDLHRIAAIKATAASSPLIGILTQINTSLTGGLQELSAQINQPQNMDSIINTYLQHIGNVIETYNGIHADYIHSIGRALLTGETTPTLGNALQWHAIGRIADMIETLQTMPRTNDAMRLATS